MQKEASEDVSPSPRSTSSSPALTGIVKAAIGQMRANVRKQRARQRALSTVTQTPDDLAWRDAEELNSDDSFSDGNDGSQASTLQRSSAEEAPSKSKVPIATLDTIPAPPTTRSINYMDCLSFQAVFSGVFESQSFCVPGYQ